MTDLETLERELTELYTEYVATNYPILQAPAWMTEEQPLAARTIEDARETS